MSCDGITNCFLLMAESRFHGSAIDMMIGTRRGIYAQILMEGCLETAGALMERERLIKTFLVELIEARSLPGFGECPDGWLTSRPHKIGAILGCIHSCKIISWSHRRSLLIFAQYGFERASDWLSKEAIPFQSAFVVDRRIGRRKNDSNSDLIQEPSVQYTKSECIPHVFLPIFFNVTCSSASLCVRSHSAQQSVGLVSNQLY
jgi:hypothetical protein